MPEAQSAPARWWGRRLIGAVGVLAFTTVAGLLALWPHWQAHVGNRELLGGTTLAAKVTSVRDANKEPSRSGATT